MKKVKPNIFATDKFGRTCLHHAANVGNIIGIEFIVKLIHYYHEKNTGEKVPDG